MIYNWKKIVRHGIPLLTLCILIEIFAGQILQGELDMLINLPILLISIPVINGVGGNIGSVLGARLASGLHVGYIDLDIKDKKMQTNLLTSIFIGIITYFVLAILIYSVASFSSTHVGIDPMKFISIVLGAGVLLVCVISFVSVFTAFWSFKKGLDPDDTVAPVVTTVGDTLGIAFLFLLIGVVGIW
ncbi:MAG: magnesium transporter [Thermoplasmatales archaeon]|nr:magnesium transporter [Thermoplasmatales archaeon]